MEEVDKRNIIKNMFINISFEFLLSIILLFVLSLLLSFTDLQENVIESAIIGISSFCVMLGGLILSRKIKSKGILIGSIQGIFYMLILYLFSSIINMNFSLTLKSLEMIGIGVICGAIGGIVGVNLK